MPRVSEHIEWLNLIDRSGPFLVPAVLEEKFPQGLEKIETPRKQRVRSAYEEWRDAIDESDPQLSDIHNAWIAMVLQDLLEYENEVLVDRENLVGKCVYKAPEHGIEISPDFAVRGDDGKYKLLISYWPPETDLEKPVSIDSWPASPLDRMTLLCRANNVRTGLVTDGERWMLVNAPVGGVSGYAAWLARLWWQEPVTLKAFQSLLGVRRSFGPAEDTLDSMLERSTAFQEEVTDTLGEQVRRAVEILIQSLGRADQDRNGDLLRDVDPKGLYEAGLTVMMRLVFTLCAEERGLLLLGDPIYDQFYAISTLRAILREEADRLGIEVLERRHDAWSRLLSTFRAIYGGVEHESLRMPAMGGSLFDPDRFPFLEGRARGTKWKENSAIPLPIDNRTVLLLLEALQILEQKGGAQLLSYRALDVEQIGHVYEGLLECTVARLDEVTIGLIGSQKVRHPSATLKELEASHAQGNDKIVPYLTELTGRSAMTIKKALEKETDESIYHRLIHACGGDEKLADRLLPFVYLFDEDSWGTFLVYRAGSFAVVRGSSRRDTGSHYTPKSLTEGIVEKTLESIVYCGPAEGECREKWISKSPEELLELKICDPAMGSGAFLVQACRFLGDRLVEAWLCEEKKGKVVTSDGTVNNTLGDMEPLPNLLDDRIILARRLIAERCLYGVDINPLAVELAKLSIWLVTMAKGRPFGFLDHNLRSGDSLLGIHRLDQLTTFSFKPEKDVSTLRLFGQGIHECVDKAIAIRLKLRSIHIRSMHEIEKKIILNNEAGEILDTIHLLADAMVGEAIITKGVQQLLRSALDLLASKANDYLFRNKDSIISFRALINKTLSSDLPEKSSPHKPFHWPIEFPEVFHNPQASGFDAIIGNPPWGASMTEPYKKWIGLLYEFVGDYESAIAFTERAIMLSSLEGTCGLVLPNTFLLNDSALVCRNNLVKNNTLLMIIDLSTTDVFIGRQVRCCTVIFSRKAPIAGTKTIVTTKVSDESYNNTLSILQIDISKKHHWSGLYKPTISLPQNGSSIGELFDVKQGYIPYRKSTLTKRFGEIEATKILESRAWHSEAQISSEYVKELKGKDVTRWQVKWSGLWVKYGEWVSTYLEPFYFQGDRVLVREIVADSPQLIIAAKCDDFYVHNPSIISAKPKKNIPGLTSLLELYLNSRIASRFITVLSAKVEKGMFPKVLIKDIRALPFIVESEITPEIINTAIDFRLKVTNDENHWENAEKFLSSILKI